MLSSSIINNNQFARISTIEGSTTLDNPYNIIKLDASSSDLTLTLPTLTPQNIKKFVYFGVMEVIRIDDFTNVNNLCKIVAENSTDLNELNEEIILDYFTTVRIYADLETLKWQSTNDFSRKRVDALMPLSSNIYVPNLDVSNFIEVNNTALPHETINILQGGIGWIIDRDPPNDKMCGRAYKVAWSPQIAIDTNPANQDGLFLLTIDKNATVELSSINDLPLTPAYLPANKNANTHLQYGLMFRNGGLIDSILPLGGERLNLANQLANLIDSLGTINSSFNPVSISFNGANTSLNLNAGQATVRNTGLLGEAGGNSPDTEILSSDIPQVPIGLVTRDNVIQSFSITANTTQIEDPNNLGTLITIRNNRAKVNSYKAFLIEGFMGEVVGLSDDYLTVQEALDSGEKPEFPSILEGGVLVQQLFVLANETNFQANAKLRTDSRVDLS